MDDLDVIILENVGNLVCPAESDTGAFLNIAILSVPEGDDKPIKYPLMFTVSDILVINKIDYLKISDFDILRVKKRVSQINEEIQVFPLSCKTSEGLEELISSLRKEITFRGIGSG